MFATQLTLTPKPTAAVRIEQEAAATLEYELLPFASSASMNGSFGHCCHSDGDSTTSWAPSSCACSLAAASSIYGSFACIDSMMSHSSISGVNAASLARAFTAVQQRCEDASAALVAPIARLRDAAFEVYQDTTGLKRFPPLTLFVPSFAPGSRVPDTERTTYYHSTVRPRAPLSALTSVGSMDVHVTAAALVLFCRVEQRLVSQGRCVTAHMMHRLLVGCLSVAIKMYGADDEAAADFLPSAVGLAAGEVGRLELQVLKDLDWACFVSVAEIHISLN